MVFKVHKPILPPTPQELAQKVTTEGLRNAIDKAISSAGDEYRTSYKKLLEQKRPTKKGINRFHRTESDVSAFLDNVYQSLPSVFKNMIDKAVDEQAMLNGLSDEEQEELRRELANVIDQELRIKGKFA